MKRFSLLAALAAVVSCGALALSSDLRAQPGPVPDGWTRAVRLIDGDTIEVSGGQRVRLYGIDAPELSDRCGPQATDTLRALLTDNGRDYNLYLEAGPRRVDEFGRTLAYVWVADGDVWSLVDEWMAIGGAARAWTADGQYRDTIIAAEQSAQRAGRGCLWQGTPPTPTAPPATAPPVSAPPVTAAPLPPAGNCHPSYPTLCLAPPPPDLDCGDIPQRRFPVLAPDPHRLDGDGDGVGCET